MQGPSKHKRGYEQLCRDHLLLAETQNRITKVNPLPTMHEGVCHHGLPYADVGVISYNMLYAYVVGKGLNIHVIISSECLYKAMQHPQYFNVFIQHMCMQQPHTPTHSIPQLPIVCAYVYKVGVHCQRMLSCYVTNSLVCFQTSCGLWINSTGM